MSAPNRVENMVQTRSGGGRVARAKPEDTRKLKKTAKRKNVEEEERTSGDVVVSPTAHLHVKKLKHELELVKQKLQWEQEHVKELSAERDFLKEQLAAKQPCTDGRMELVKQQKAHNEVYISCDSSSSSDSSFAPDTSLESSSSEDSHTKKKKSKAKKMKKKYKKKSKDGSKKRSKDQRQVQRARVPDEVVARYQKVLKVFQRGRSLSAACEKVRVDRNTIVCNAAVAELAIAAPQKYDELKQKHNPREKLSDFTKACIGAIHNDTVIKDSIKTLKGSGQLLPCGKGTF